MEGHRQVSARGRFHVVVASGVGCAPHNEIGISVRHILDQTNDGIRYIGGIVIHCALDGLRVGRAGHGELKVGGGEIVGRAAAAENVAAHSVAAKGSKAEPVGGGDRPVGRAIFVAEEIDVRQTDRQFGLAVAHRFAAHGEVGGVHDAIAVDVVVLHHLHRLAGRQPAHMKRNEARVIVAHDVGRNAERRSLRSTSE